MDISLRRDAAQNSEMMRPLSERNGLIKYHHRWPDSAAARGIVAMRADRLQMEEG